MIDDETARIVILGAGPIGIEAALYARFLGHHVEVYERGRVADNVFRWGHVRMFSPFLMNRSTLGLAALDAQDASYQPPSEEALLTGAEWAERYLVPLAKTDLLADHIRPQTSVISVSRSDLLKHELPGSPKRGESSFRVLLADKQRRQWEVPADVVIDTTGVYGNPNWMGKGGAPAIGAADGSDLPKYDYRGVLRCPDTPVMGAFTFECGRRKLLPPSLRDKLPRRGL